MITEISLYFFFPLPHTSKKKSSLITHFHMFITSLLQHNRGSLTVSYQCLICYSVVFKSHNISLYI